MKDYLPLERQRIPNYEASGFLGTIKRSAREHGYRSALWYGLVRLKDHLFGSWAMRFPVSPGEAPGNGCSASGA